jgi:alkanesulfonate monooxygenase SsuD/methylene tetrahydromethanopterin reductase-like flavin-dependent oxidoreductase (luciferase family)
MNMQHQFREAKNPMFNDNKLKLGTFGTNCSNACAITLAETTFEPTFEHNVKIAKQLEEAGWECMVPIARWRGFGGPSNFNGVNMDSFTWAAALAAVTTKLQFFSTTHVPTLHPIVATKMATTIDHIAKGRYGLNLVLWLVHAGNGDVWCSDDGTRYPLRLRRRMAANRHTAVERKRR